MSMFVSFCFVSFRIVFFIMEKQYKVYRKKNSYFWYRTNQWQYMGVCVEAKWRKNIWKPLVINVDYVKVECLTNGIEKGEEKKVSKRKNVSKKRGAKSYRKTILCLYERRMGCMLLPVEEYTRFIFAPLACLIV